MRIARVSERSVPLPGGKEIHVAELSRAQVAQGHDVTMYIRSGSSEIDGVLIKQIRPLPPLGRAPGLIGTAAFMQSVARLMKRSSDYDLVHLHGDLVEAYFGGRAAHKLEVPCVLTVHGGLNPRLVKISARAFASVDRFIAVANHVAEDLAQCSVPSEKISILGSGLNWDLLRPWMKRRPESGQAQLVSVGSLERVKGHDITIDAVRQLHGSRPEVVLRVIGEGRLRADLEAQAKGDARIEFLSSRAREQVYAVLSAATLFILASRSLPGKREGTPTALLEAMALGLPVVVTTSANASGVVIHNKNGLVVPSDDSGALSRAVLQLLDDERLRDNLGQAAFTSVKDRGWDQTAEKIEEVYAKALEPSG